MNTSDTQKHCGQCTQTKPISDFKKKFNGDYQKSCSICLIKARNYARNNRAKTRAAMKLSKLRNPIGTAIWRCKNHDKRHNRYFNLDREYIEAILELQDGFCFHCDKLLELTNGRPYNPNQISIDRIRNDKPHEYGNVVLSCYFCNLSRHTKSIEEFTPASSYLMIDYDAL